MSEPGGTLEDTLQRFASTFKQDLADAPLLQLTEKLIEVLRKDDNRQMAQNTAIELRDKLHKARRMGHYRTEADMMDIIAGNMQMSEDYKLQSIVDMVQDPSEHSETRKDLNQIHQQSLPYEFLNTCEAQEMTVNIKVPPSTKKDDVKVKITTTTIRVEVRNHEIQPCIIDGQFFRPVDTGGCDFHLEGSGNQRMLVVDLEKKEGGYKWAELLGFGDCAIEGNVGRL
eukprot:gnl/MRDRNA2_/MRDRNA2_95476_c0_seq1.p1 gnl/MRDRNA2_/MRDRNA2_95476_c0~~gnl/MRDRNA2_/MRDRNA2_95476_c0_seq1.p1  ORF type:complete len:252 (-),score=63.29 gnl/MRDRNA2_/MRDRNA2_95476_c0_seq1:79-759(-)